MIGHVHINEETLRWAPQGFEAITGERDANPVEFGPKFVRVVAPHFVAGMDCANGKCIEAAPILKWAKGKSEDELRKIFAAKGWRASVIDWREHVNQL